MTLQMQDALSGHIAEECELDVIQRRCAVAKRGHPVKLRGNVDRGPRIPGFPVDLEVVGRFRHKWWHPRVNSQHYPRIFLRRATMPTAPRSRAQEDGSGMICTLSITTLELDPASAPVIAKKLISNRVVPAGAVKSWLNVSNVALARVSVALIGNPRVLFEPSRATSCAWNTPPLVKVRWLSKLKV